MAWRSASRARSLRARRPARRRRRRATAPRLRPRLLMRIRSTTRSTRRTRPSSATSARRPRSSLPTLALRTARQRAAAAFPRWACSTRTWCARRRDHAPFVGVPSGAHDARAWHVEDTARAYVRGCSRPRLGLQRLAARTPPAVAGSAAHCDVRSRARAPPAAQVMKHIIPVVMAGVLGIYGLIIAVIIGNGVQTTKGGAVPAYTGERAHALGCRGSRRARGAMPLHACALVRCVPAPRGSAHQRLACAPLASAPCLGVRSV